MRRAIVASVMLARVASAEPAYVQLGAQLGSDYGHGFVAGRLDGGYRLGRTPLWAHAGAALGSALSLNLGGDLGDKEYVSGSLREIAGGVEARVCRSIACGVAGVDVGYRSVRYDLMDVTDPSRSIHFQHASAIGTPRLQLDVGGDRIRARLTFEWPNLSGAQVAIGVALQL